MIPKREIYLFEGTRDTSDMSLIYAGQAVVL